LPAHLDPTKSKMDEQRNKTIIAFARGASYADLDSPARNMNMSQHNSKKSLNSPKSSPKRKMVATQNSVSITSDDLNTRDFDKTVPKKFT